MTFLYSVFWREECRGKSLPTGNHVNILAELHTSNVTCLILFEFNTIKSRITDQVNRQS
jgi:hypothetical protein